MRSARQARATPAIAALVASGIWHRVYEYDHDSTTANYGREAVEKLQVADMLNFKRLSTALGVRSVRMADAAIAQRKTGYVLGGISPLGQKTGLPTVFDDSVARHDTVWVSGGRRGLSLELQVPDLVHLTQATVAHIRR